MSLRKYKRIKYLGKGSYGAAILVQLRANESKKFVIKEIVIGHLQESEQAAAKKEAEVLHQMQHSNITMYIESFVESSKLYIVMEFADGGDLSNTISQRKKTNQYWQENELMRILVQICLALKHVHDQNILHRDLKSQNIFLTTKGIVKLGDFGIAKVLDATEDQAKTQIGTPYYLSPEICESSPYGRSSDVWSLGIVLFELLCLELPFQASSLPVLVSRIISGDPNWGKVPSHFSKSIMQLTTSMLEKNPQSRPTLKQVVSTDFLKSHISKLLSYTLRERSGGVHAGPSTKGGEGAGDRGATRGADAASHSERYEREKKELLSAQRDQELVAKDEHLVADREASREKEREKLRRFRQEMIMKKKRDGGGGNGGGDAVNPFHLPKSRYGDRLGAGREDEASSREPPKYEVAVSASPSQRQAEEDKASIARQQFFANRRVAAAVKARVEAEERGYPLGDNWKEVQDAPQQQGGGRVRSGADWSNVDAETKIAALRAKSKLEKERQLAEQEEQLKLAHEANREERRRLETRRMEAKEGDDSTVAVDAKTPPRRNSKDLHKQAIAFDIDIDMSTSRRTSKVGGGATASGAAGSDATAYDRDFLDDDVEEERKGATIVLNKLRERRAREKVAREKARLVFQRLQEQRRIQQRVKQGAKLTKAEEGKQEERQDASGESDAAADDDLEATLDRFLVGHKPSKPMEPDSSGDSIFAMSEKSPRLDKRKNDAKNDTDVNDENGDDEDNDNGDDPGDEEIEDLAGMLARQLVDDAEVEL
jgi:tRNA A-37 threonylcarbamoyl transferase component Bud32